MALICSGSLIQSTFFAEGSHNLEAVIARPQDPDGTRNTGFFTLQHYRLVPTTWQLGDIVTRKAIGPGAFVSTA